MITRGNDTSTQRRAGRGFTLFELMVVLAVLGILTMTGLPFFKQMIEQTRIKSASFDVLAALMRARSEAVRRNTQITVAPNDGVSWQSGWTVTNGGKALSQQVALPNNLTITCFAAGQSTSPCPALTYGSNGRLSANTTQAPAIQISTSDANTNSAVMTRCIDVDITGLPKSKQANCP